MNAKKLNFTILNASVLNTSRLNTSGMGGGKASGGITPPDEYVLNNAVLLKNGKPLLLADGTPLVLLPKSEEPELDASLVDAWIFSGYKNEDAPATIAGVNGIELTCYNFAWNEEGSGFKDGALWFDGSDDYLYGDNLPALTNYSIITKRINNTFRLYSNLARKYKEGDPVSYSTFSFELDLHGNWVTNPDCVINFGNRIDINEEYVPELYSYMTYNGQTVNYNGYQYEQTDKSVEDGNLLTIGGNEGFFCLNCKLYWIALYSRSLTESEIQSEIAKLEAMWNKRLNNN